MKKITKTTQNERVFTLIQHVDVNCNGRFHTYARMSTITIASYFMIRTESAATTMRRVVLRIARVRAHLRCGPPACQPRCRRSSFCRPTIDHHYMHVNNINMQHCIYDPNRECGGDGAEGGDADCQGDGPPTVRPASVSTSLPPHVVLQCHRIIGKGIVLLLFIL